MARILLADDDQNARDFVARALTTAGHAVVAADDGADAFAKLKSDGPFDVLLTDVQMPGLNGIELTRQAITIDSKLQVVMMSGYPDILDQARAALKGPISFLAKPFSIESIRSAVATALKR